MGEAATEHEARLKKEIIDSYEKGDTKLGDSLTEEQARTSTAYSVAKEDYKQDLANPSFGKILNGLKEKIQKLLGRKK